jgi:hypothetical protein
MYGCMHVSMYVPGAALPPRMMDCRGLQSDMVLQSDDYDLRVTITVLE